MRRKLLSLCTREKPLWVHFRLPLAFSRKHIMAIKETGAVVTQYFNDDPFSADAVFGLNWRFRNALPAYDAHFVYRKHNVESFLSAGAKQVEHCPPALDVSRFGEIERHSSESTFAHDAAFVGHFERDGRLEHLEAMFNAGFDVIVHGSGWADPVKNSDVRHLFPAEPVFGAAYGRIYASSRFGLCFFSKINRDTWTERPLEIIALGGLLVCERTDEALGYFKEGEEAFFFSSPAELVAVCERLKSDPALCNRVRQAARRKLFDGTGFTILDRAVQVESVVRRQLDSASRRLL